LQSPGYHPHSLRDSRYGLFVTTVQTPFMLIKHKFSVVLYTKQYGEPVTISDCYFIL
jgi:hypothetical protein